jgi:hypothetical protein
LSISIPRLNALEGFAFEKLIRKLHLECSRKGKGDFELTQMRLGYWNRAGTSAQNIEIDLVAIDAVNKKIRFGSCQRSEHKHDAQALAKFEQHISGFLATRDYKYLESWVCEKVLFSPVFSATHRNDLKSKGFACYDLNDFARLLRA